MKISAISVCVSYSDLLRKSIEIWKRTLDGLLVVTTPTDADTMRLCEAWDVPTFVTTAFFDDGAAFNQGKAKSLAFDFLQPSDWCLWLDADIVPPPDWRDIADPLIRPGALFGAPRTREDGSLIQDRELAGYFQLFHTSDPGAQQRPIVDTCWPHCGCHDSYFANRWARHDRIWLPFTVTHLGNPGENWFGRGNLEMMNQMRAERAKQGGHQHERIKLADI
jgi:hypothetical protein